MLDPAFLNYTLGAAFLGCIAASILYGVTSVQTFIYLKNTLQDGRLFMTLIFSLWIWDTLHLAVTIHGIYWYIITNFGNISSIQYALWSLVAGVYLTNVSDIIVRCVYARRVSTLCGKRRSVLRILLPAIIILLALVVFICGVSFASYAFELKTFDELNRVSVFLYVSFAAAVVADLTVAISLCILLFHSRTGIKKTDSLVTILMAFTINTGLLTSLCAIACFVTYAIWPNRFVFLGLYFPLSKLYVNSLLASLNARASLRRRDDRSTTTSDRSPDESRNGAVSTQIVFPMVSRSTQNTPFEPKETILERPDEYSG